MFKKIKRKLKKVREYFKLRKKLGGGFRVINIPALRDFRLVLVEDKTERKGLIEIQDEQIVICPFKERYFNYWIDSNTGNNIIIEIGSYCFKKQKHWESAIEIKQLEDCYVSETWGNNFLLFNYGYLLGYLLNIEDFKIQQFDNVLEANGLKAIYKAENGCYIYWYYYNGKIEMEGPFKKQFEYEKRYQINGLANESGETIYEIKEDGFHRVTDISWNNIVPTLINKEGKEEYYKGTNEEICNLVRIDKESFGIFRIPDGDIDYIDEIFDEEYYEIVGDKKVWLMTFDEKGKPIIQGVYIGKEITFSDPILDVKEGEIKRQILIWNKEVGKQ